ncbi:MAG: phosphoenolpyruvate carboxykinase (ATP) [Clostridium sp.]
MDTIKEQLDFIDIRTTGNIYRNLSVKELIEKSLENNEGTLSDKGALIIDTGRYTGRSPKDRFIVMQDSIKENINWEESNLPVEEKIFDNLYKKVANYLEKKDIYVFDGQIGAAKEYSLSIRVINELASQNLFATQLFRRLNESELKSHKAEFTIIAAPGFKADGEKDGINSEAFIIINFDKKIVLIGGSQYSGEIKKSMFSVMNYIMPEKNVFPMHCSANKDEEGNTAIFFGLSGTGKTTLSADPDRVLIGDDEHGWSDKGVFNFEGGCYAKVIKLERAKEKEIYDAIKFGTVLENVVANEKGEPDYNDGSKTENTRAGYPIEYIPNADIKGVGGNPNTVIFLTADAFGVLPPISKLSKEAAMYHFMSGYTSKLSGTERGITDPKATFSACFGEPFMLRSPYVYAELLGQRIEKNETQVYLVNTGWTGGPYGVGSRMNLSYTRAMVKAAISGELAKAEFTENKLFNLFIPKEIKGVPSNLLNPENTWADKLEYNKKAQELVVKFNENFNRYKNVPSNIINAGPRIK